MTTVSDMNPFRPVFDAIYLTDEWGKGSGQGSDPINAAPYVALLRNLLSTHRRILDIGCGDGRIANALDLDPSHYWGQDCSQEALDLFRQTCSLPCSLDFPPWEPDIILIKDVLQHLPMEEVVQLLSFYPGIPKVVTNDIPIEVYSDPPVGGWRPIDIRDHGYSAIPLLRWRCGNTSKMTLWVT